MLGGAFEQEEAGRKKKGGGGESFSRGLGYIIYPLVRGIREGCYSCLIGEIRQVYELDLHNIRRWVCGIFFGS